MSNVAKLKKQAAEFELKRQFDKALAIYVKLLDSFDQYPDEVEVALFNRVGDLMLRQGNVADAVDYYEQAVDRYADTGFFNNAIALCNKILRHSPGRASVYYKLGKISAQKGFKNDAKVNFLEYADRMQKSGQVDESFRALKEFADLCPDQDEIRLMLADQLTKADRKAEAVEQLQTLHERYDSEGRLTEARATAERMRTIDPSVEPRSGGGGRKSSSAELIFLDLDAPSPRDSGNTKAVSTFGGTPTNGATPPTGGAANERPTPSATPSNTAPIRERAGAPDGGVENSDVGSQLSGMERIGDDALGIEKATPDSLLGLESTSLADDTARPDESAASPLLGIEPTSLDTPAPITPARGSTPPVSAPRPSTPRASAAALDGLPMMDVDAPPSTPRRPTYPDDVRTPTTELPLLDISDEADFDMPGNARLSNGRATPRNSEADIDVTGEHSVVPTPPVARPSTLVAAHSVELLRANVELEPENWGLRRRLAEVMLDAGERIQGIRELETAMIGAERSGDLDLASGIAEEIARLEPELVKHHQKRVEYAFRTNDRARLIEAYLSLADALLGSDQADKARAVYQRVIDLAPDEMRAQSALDAIVIPEPPPPPPAPTHRRMVTSKPHADSPAKAGGESFVNLGDWLRGDEGPRDTRMVVAEQEPSGDEAADFADMLRKFKQGVAENVDPEDYQSHYDLAIAFKEMGLLDEAISEFQKALGSRTNRLPTYEALGQCFLDKGQPKLAASILSRALNEQASEEQMVGVFYLLGLAAETNGKPEEALGYYNRVFVLDIQFRDVADRLAELERLSR